MQHKEIIADVLRQIRKETIRVLEMAEDNAAVLFAPSGTSNHMIWHAGHAIWLQDLLCLRLLGHRSEIDDKWEQRYGMDCRPLSETSKWPTKDEMLKLLSDQQQRMLDVIEASEPADLNRVADPSRGPLTVSSRIIHGCHDEAKHSGEMYLLLKLFRVMSIERTSD